MRGGQRQVLLLMAGLRAAGHECVLLAASRGALREEANSAGFAVRNAGLAACWRESQKAALVHAHDAHAHTLAAIASRRMFVVSRRVAFPIGRSIASRWKYRRAARYIAVSRFVARELEAAGVPKEEIEIIHDAVEIAAQADGWSAGNPAVALASDDPQKGRDLIEQAVEISGIPVRFSEDLANDLRAASMFVYITRSEGLGSAVLLAMGMGVPVIASRVGGLPEVVEDGVSGLLVANQPQEIARAMQRLLDEPSLANSIVARAKTNITSRFTKERLITATLHAYERTLAG